MTTIARNRASFEYVTVSLTGNVALGSQPVEIAVTAGQPTEDDWQTADWIGTEGTSRQARLGPITPPATGRWRIFVRVTDIPEIPVIQAGSLYLT